MVSLASPQVPIRQPDFAPVLADLPPRFAVGGNIVLSHVIAVLSSVFPDGEDYFVQSVRQVSDRIEDQQLRLRVEGFIGQESMHGREHRNLNRRLARLGYPTRIIERWTAALSLMSERRLSEEANLAVTAALEHHTAVIAETLLSEPAARASIDHEGVRSMFLWHALEESEHKSVAFDVFHHVGGSYRMRSVAMYIVNLDFVFEVAAWTAVSLALDPEARHHPRAVLHDLWDLRHSPFLSRRTFARLRDYHRRDFHPDDVDSTELIARWRSELFGAEGELAELA